MLIPLVMDLWSGPKEDKKPLILLTVNSGPKCHIDLSSATAKASARVVLSSDRIAKLNVARLLILQSVCCQRSCMNTNVASLAAYYKKHESSIYGDTDCCTLG